MNLTYYFFLLLIIFLLIMLIKKNKRYSPIKIKIYMYVVISLLLLRYIALFFLCIIRNGIYIYSLKGLLYLNYLAIPLIVIALSYVYLRWSKLSFKINYIIASVLSLLYIIEMYFTDGKVHFNVDYGYIITLKNETLVFLFYFITLGMLLIFCIYFSDKPNCNRFGMFSLIIALAIVIIENVLFLGGIKIFPYPIIGDAFFLILMNLGLNTFR